MTDEKRMYSSETLGLPPLKMVLVHSENDRQNAASKPAVREQKAEVEKEKIVQRIIDHLNGKSDR